MNKIIKEIYDHIKKCEKENKSLSFCKCPVYIFDDSEIIMSDYFIDYRKEPSLIGEALGKKVYLISDKK